MVNNGIFGYVSWCNLLKPNASFCKLWLSVTLLRFSHMVGTYIHHCSHCFCIAHRVDWAKLKKLYNGASKNI